MQLLSRNPVSKRKLASYIGAAIFALTCMSSTSFAQGYDLVIRGARVVDPETMLDQVRNIGITDKEISVVTPDDITGRDVIDATGLVAAPGFIDVHAHGQDPYSEKVSLFDGRTTQMDLEAARYRSQNISTPNQAYLCPTMGHRSATLPRDFC